MQYNLHSPIFFCTFAAPMALNEIKERMNV